tara:strand:+ start:94 stop:324 length:231 start_codon:yes stop_codon:yes gene_type:complete
MKGVKIRAPYRRFLIYISPIPESGKGRGESAVPAPFERRAEPNQLSMNPVSLTMNWELLIRLSMFLETGRTYANHP